MLVFDTQRSVWFLCTTDWRLSEGWESQVFGGGYFACSCNYAFSKRFPALSLDLIAASYASSSLQLPHCNALRTTTGQEQLAGSKDASLWFVVLHSVFCIERDAVGV